MKRCIAVIALTLCVAACGGPKSVPFVAGPGLARVARPSSSPTPVTIAVDADAVGAAISQYARGANFAAWYDITHPGIATAAQSIGLRFGRWPGGSFSDQYHWQTNTWCGGGYANPNSTFDNFMNDVAIPARLKMAITVDYGSNAACNAGGDPAEAAAWVDYANNVKHYGITHWTVGNEVYGSWEYDLHQVKNDPTTYANAVATGFYPQMKAKDPSISVGIDVAGGYSPSWDQYVLAHAKFDFVEDHYYAQAPGSENDAYLLDQAPQALAQELQNVRSEMDAAGVPASVPIYLGEFGSVYANPGKQSVSIVGGLFTGEAVAQVLQLGLPMSTVWLAFGGCNTGNNSPSLYGWQDFGTYTIFSDGLPENGCGQPISFGTDFPSARAYQLISHFAVSGGKMLGTTVGPTGSSIRAYAATQGSGYALLLFDLSETSPASATISLTNATRTSFNATSFAYDKTLYDKSKNGVWAGLRRSSLGTVGTTFSLTLTPWSMTVVVLK
jgi:hypothetical protein